MKRIAIFLIFFIFQVSPALSEDVKLQLEIDSNISEKIEVLDNRISEVRRDQLNYSIEKDLLKEAYSSNLETINIVITVVLGTFSVLAFFGIKSIWNIREEFTKELQQFSSVRAQSEIRLKEIEIQQNDAEKKLISIAEINTAQDTRLKTLEIIEKINSLLVQNNYQYALQYIEIGLEIDRDNIILLQQKEHCFLRLRRYQDAKHVDELILALDVKNTNAAMNLCEISLLLGDRTRFDELRIQYSDAISKIEYLAWIFEAYVLYFDGNDDELMDRIKVLSENMPEVKKKHTQWSFDEFRYVIDSKKSRDVTPILMQTLEALEGKSSFSEIIKEDNVSAEDKFPL